ncbi:TPA: hypothetical protein RG395_003163 [Legionella pneumophila]|nr:hypothetical protein [Legionella pneumophila]HAT3977619.1 hypothetical protein [Legionella pneumophila]HAU1208383.1 hypothetical protein [Legionella pneumophila]HAU1284975.1 hypothetical protein [Legionella pneumophila]HAU1960775.1 hypothetical protein [Legionella pneumophila]HBC2758493.1 hypothetical protein [Legionella pneumophila]
MKAKKEIRAVSVNEWCIETDPCEHDVTIEYADGSRKTKSKEVETIINKYGRYLSKKDSEISCFASFFREQQSKISNDEEPNSSYQPS